jgi:outer membrane lipopolysaccharide assembly protein LptE/RlpB
VRFALVLLLTAASTSSCGYHVAGKADLLPKTIKTIAIPAFANVTTRHRLSEQLPAAITREFISRTRYKVVADPQEADAVLEGTVATYNWYGMLSPAGRTSEVQVILGLSVTLRERATGAVLYSRPSADFKERYEIASDPRAYFEESDVALERLSRDVARTVVSGILEKF